VFLIGLGLSSPVIDCVRILYRVGSYRMAMIYSNVIVKKEFITSHLKIWSLIWGIETGGNYEKLDWIVFQ
jgi:hypothetical protein